MTNEQSEKERLEEDRVREASVRAYAKQWEEPYYPDYKAQNAADAASSISCIVFCVLPLMVGGGYALLVDGNPFGLAIIAFGVIMTLACLVCACPDLAGA